MSYVLGISAYYHDSAAALLKGGEIIAAAQEERFSRKKQDSRFPANAIRSCLKQAGISLEDLERVAYYEKPSLKFHRLLHTYFAFAPKGLSTFVTDMPHWLTDKLHVESELKRQLAALGLHRLPELSFFEHHQSHAASAFFASPFPHAAVLCIDGVGEWATTSVWQGRGASLTPLWQLDFPHSIGLLYSSFTYFCGFKVDSGEYKLMGLAPYGRPIYRDLILEHLLDLKADGTFRLNMKYFDFATGLTMTNAHFEELFGGPPRAPESEITQREFDLAASVQVVTEEIVMALARTIHAETGEPYLCLSGGVALNCVANGRLLREGPFKDIWVQPAAGDAGGALGAAYAAWHFDMKKARTTPVGDAMKGAFLGSSYSPEEIKAYLDSVGAMYRRLDGDAMPNEVGALLAKDNVVGWFQGRMEFGPRALGARSILGNPCSSETQSVMNLKIKKRESFRPFAPAVLAEKASEWFNLSGRSPYMSIVAPVLKRHCRETSDAEDALFGLDKLKVVRSTIPAVTHVDYSARIQTVHRDLNPRFHRVIEAFERLTGCPVIVNTSFNVRGEPIVESPRDAYACFMRTAMDYLVLGDFLLDKSLQPEWKDPRGQMEFELD
ncbi:carbamoyltransferase [Pendulispora rubella]|uniref:Carbamoyltransferase n=1 Tax=Pendulispora rubella TaxID=2741070 RepID=A0ABZ2LLP8_9BACT